MSTLTHRSLPVLTVALAALIGFAAGPAAAQNTGAAVITQFEGAAEAVDLCGNKLTLEQTAKVAAMAQERGGYTVPAGDMLVLKEQARDSTRVRRFGLNGCNDPIVRERIQFFEQTVRPGL